MARSKSSKPDGEIEEIDADPEVTGSKGDDKSDDGSLVATFVAGALVGGLMLFLAETYDAQLKKAASNAKPAS